MISGPDTEPDPAQFTVQLFTAVICFLLWAGGVFGVITLIHFLFTLPLRRAERARLFLDLLEAACKRGQSVEEMILSVAQTRDRTVGIHFHLLAAHIENGSRFGDALKNVPGFVPPQLSAILDAGGKLGDFGKVLPAGREILRERPVAVRSAMHYLILVAFCFSPVFITVLMLTNVFVIPKFRDVAAGMGVRLRPEAIFVFNNTGFLAAVEICLALLMAIAVLLYIGGPQFTRLFKLRQIPIVDWIAWHIAWKQKRLQRTFSAMLSVLLDGGVPEAEAVRLAGDCTANEISRRRTARHRRPGAGAKLEEAIRRFDHSGEFYWRLSNAAQARGGFLSALRGWHEALDAKAFQQEEAAAHIITTGVVILNGALVALVATAMFGLLTFILTRMLD